MVTDLCGTLERVLSGLVVAHEELLELAREQRAAMSRADGAGVEACTRRQGEIVHRVTKLEEERRKVIAALGGGLGGVGTSVTQVAAGLPEPARGRIIGISLRLREVLFMLQEQNRVLRAAAGALAAHMDGLIQQVSRRMSDAGAAGVYGRQGKVVGGPGVCALDMRY